jgi:tellurite resistance protein TerC
MAIAPFKRLRRVGVAILGFSVLALGIAMIVLPGPAIVVVPLGVGILATEYGWARYLQRKIRDYVAKGAKWP